MRMSLTQTSINGQTFTLTLECADMTAQQERDLDHDDARGRINMVMARELNRFTEVATVAMQDAHMKRQVESLARRDKEERRRLGKPEPEKPPAVILGTGSKNPETHRRYVDPKTGADLGHTLPSKE